MSNKKRITKHKHFFQLPFHYDEKTMLIKSKDGIAVAMVNQDLYKTADMIVDALNYHAVILRGELEKS